MKKRIVSALMAMAMCTSALPMSVCAENSANSEPSEFAKRFRDECLISSEEIEENEDFRLSYNFFEYERELAERYNERFGRLSAQKTLGIATNPCDDFGGYCAEDCYSVYSLLYARDDCYPYARIPNHDDIEAVQVIYRYSYYYSMDVPEFATAYTDGDAFEAWMYSEEEIANMKFAQEVIENLNISIKEIAELDPLEQIPAIAKIFDETGASILLTPINVGSPYIYIGENGKAYDTGGNELNIVDGKTVPVYNNTLDNADVLTAETLKGDANEDGKVSISDAVLIMQALSNPDEFKLTEQGAINADYNEDGSVTTADALAIQMIDIS